MILRLRMDAKTSRLTADPCPGITVNRARGFSGGDVEIDFDFAALQGSKPHPMPMPAEKVYVPRPADTAYVPEKHVKRSK